MYYADPSLHPDRIMEDHDFVYMLEGEWEVREEGRAFCMVPGDVLILAAGRHHYGRKECRSKTRTLFFHTRAFHRELAGEAGGDGIHLPSLVHCSASPEVVRCFRRLVDAFWSNAPTRSLELSSLFQLLLCELASASSMEAYPFRRLIAEAQSRMRMDQQGALSTKELAERLGVSVRKLRYAFERELGIPPHRYHRDLRLDMSMKMLQTEPGHTLREIAEAFGFYDEFHFSRAFKRRFGIPPSQISTQPQIPDLGN